MIHQALLRALLPWHKRQAPAAAAAAFNARQEQLRVSEQVLRQAARLLAEPVGEASDTAAKVQSFCNAITAASSHLPLCWTWFGDADTPEIVPQIIAGRAAGYARQLCIERNAITALGPAFRVLGGSGVEPCNVNESSLYGPWRDVARSEGVRSALALPLVSTTDARRGLFVLYADVPDYFNEVGVGLFEAMAELVSSVLSQARRNEQLERLARHDTLTGLHNRAAAHALIETLRDAQPAAPHCLMLLDLDRFKQVNDNHGHAAGDAVLVACAKRLALALRHNDGVARWGGEEFVVWLPDTPIAQAQRVAQKLRQSMADQVVTLPDGTPASVTVSIGLVAVGPAEPLDAAVARADQAMYTSKQGGRNRVTVG